MNVINRTQIYEDYHMKKLIDRRQNWNESIEHKSMIKVLA